jgi:hypothetical protein
MAVVTPFPSAAQLVGYAGLGARVRASGQAYQTGRITNMILTPLITPSLTRMFDLIRSVLSVWNGTSQPDARPFSSTVSTMTFAPASTANSTSGYDCRVAEAANPLGLVGSSLCTVWTTLEIAGLGHSAETRESVHSRK